MIKRSPQAVFRDVRHRLLRLREVRRDEVHVAQPEALRVLPGAVRPDPRAVRPVRRVGRVRRVRAVRRAEGPEAVLVGPRPVAPGQHAVDVDPPTA